FAGHAKLFHNVGVAQRQFESHPEKRLLKLVHSGAEVVIRQISQLVALHTSPPPSRSLRVTNLVLIGSFCAASLIASAAVFSSTPSISNSTRPGLTTATQPSGAPLPLPIRVSAGFLVMGLSGNTRIQILPPRFTKRVIATREASICLPVIHAGSIAFSPYSPKEISAPRVAAPLMRPRCCLRYFIRFGILYSAIVSPILDFGFWILDCRTEATSSVKLVPQSKI